MIISEVLVEPQESSCYNCKVQMTPKKALYTPTELAGILGVSRQEVIRRIWRGFIKAEKVGNQYIITKTEVNKAVKEQRKRGLRK